MSHKTENTSFVCRACGRNIEAMNNGGYRNHCPYCLCSLHLDNRPGDRASGCHGLMMPIGLAFKGGKGTLLVHRCVVCGATSRNRIAEMTVQPDDIEAILRLAPFCDEGVRID